MVAGLSSRGLVRAGAEPDGEKSAEIQEKKPGILCLREVDKNPGMGGCGASSIEAEKHSATRFSELFLQYRSAENKYKLAKAGGETKECPNKNQFDFIFLETGAQQILKFL